MLLLLLLTTLTARASASETARLSVSLSPEKLGHGTTIGFSFTLGTTTGALPPPLTEILLSYPAGIGVITSGLGLATCEAPELELSGPEGCSAEALMGYGTATAVIQVEHEWVSETAEITTWLAPVRHRHLQLLFYADGHTPLSTEYVLPGAISPATGPYGGTIETDVPLLPTFSEGPHPAIVKMHTTLGPRGIYYYRHAHGHIIPYHPTGLQLPYDCPRHGFPFSGTFTFLDGTTTTSTIRVPCPKA